MGSSTPSAPTSNPYVKKIDYNYDDDGNRSSVVVTPYGQSPTTTNYTTNNLNEYTAVGGTSQTHDANGNLTDNGTYKFEYNYKNLIVKVRLKADSSLIATYRYDAEGRRVEKTWSEGTERYIRSRVREAEGSSRLGNNPGGGGRYDMSHVIAVYDGSDNWLQNFVWNDEVDGVQMLEQKDVLDYDTDGNTTELTRSYYHRNALGSVMEITDANQAAVASYRYDPYGSITITRGGQTQSSDPLGQHWGFTGRFHDEESGLVYYRARYYDPATGRFLQRDPLGYSEGPILFSYCEDMPTNHRDPTGLLTEEERQRQLARAVETYLRATEENRDPEEYARGVLGTALSELLKWLRRSQETQDLPGGGIPPAPNPDPPPFDLPETPPEEEKPDPGHGFRPWWDWPGGPFAGIRWRGDVGGGTLTAGIGGGAKWRGADDPFGFEDPFGRGEIGYEFPALGGKFGIRLGIEVGEGGKLGVKSQAGWTKDY